MESDPIYTPEPEAAPSQPRHAPPPRTPLPPTAPDTRLDEMARIMNQSGEAAQIGDDAHTSSQDAPVGQVKAIEVGRQETTPIIGGEESAGAPEK